MFGALTVPRRSARFAQALGDLSGVPWAAASRSAPRWDPWGWLPAWPRKTGMRAVSVDYRLAPEHPYPAALHDVTAAYRALVEQAGSADHIVVSGESAGGNLARTAHTGHSGPPGALTWLVAVERFR